MSLLPHQQAAIEAVLEQFHAEGLRKQVVQMATGAGKTRFAAALAQALLGPHERCLFLAHREELLLHGREEFLDYFPSSDLGLVQAGNDQPRRRIVFASEPTLRQPARLQRVLNPGPFRLVIVDECHHSVAAKYLALLRTLAQRDPLFVGLSATPSRSDGRSLRVFWDDLTYSVGILELITCDPPMLCDLKSVNVVTDLDLSGVDESENGDFNLEQIAQALKRPSNRHSLAVQAIRQHAPRDQGIYFGGSVADAEAFTHYVTRCGITCMTVHGKTPREEREAALEAFRGGDIQYLSNMMVLTEGVDLPNARVGIIGRPTKSVELYTQIVGRLARLLPEDRGKPFSAMQKPFSLIIGLVDINHTVQTVADLVGSTDEVLTHRTVREAVEEAEEQALREPIEQPLLLPEHVPLLMTTTSLFSQAKWVRRGRDFHLRAPGYGVAEAKWEMTGYQVVYRGDNGVTRYLTQRPLRAELAFGIGEQFLGDQARQAQARQARRTDDGTRARPASENQKARLKHSHLPCWDRITVGQVQDIWDELSRTKSPSAVWQKFGPKRGGSRGQQPQPRPASHSGTAATTDPPVS